MAQLINDLTVTQNDYSVLSNILGQVNEMKQESLNPHTESNDNLFSQLIELQEVVNKEISSVLYHDVIQMMYSNLLRFKLIRNSKSTDDVAKHVQDIEEATEGMLKKVKKISFHLYPLMIDDLGLIPTLKALNYHMEESYETTITFSCEDIDSYLSNQKQMCMYRIYQFMLSYLIIERQIEQIDVNIYFEEAGSICIDIQVSDGTVLKKFVKETNTNPITEKISHCKGETLYSEAENRLQIKLN